MATGQRRRGGSTFQDLTGRTFNHLTVLRQAESSAGLAARWECRCACGRLTKVTTHDLSAGRIKSCGCSRKKHGQCDSLTYSSWASMTKRCRNQNDPEYPNYGGRGITVCDRWLVFENFRADMGERPGKRFSIDRYPDPNGNYEPGNCRWATATEQARNRRNSISLTINGETRLALEWAEQYGVSPERVLTRLREGWDAERALSTPIQESRFTPGTLRPGQFQPETNMQTLNGETLPLAEWASRCGITYGAMLLRLNAGWPLDKALTRRGRGGGRRKTTPVA